MKRSKLILGCVLRLLLSVSIGMGVWSICAAKSTLAFYCFIVAGVTFSYILFAILTESEEFREKSKQLFCKHDKSALLPLK